MGIEKFYIDKLIGWAECYPEFEEKFIETFDSKKSLEVCVKLTININSYFEYGYDYDGEYFEYYNYENMILDLSIHYGIYKNKEEFEEDYYDEYTEESLEDKFFEFYRDLEEIYPKFYKELKKKGLTDKQIYDDAFNSSRKYEVNWNFGELAKKYNLSSIFEEDTENAIEKGIMFDISNFI